MCCCMPANVIQLFLPSNHPESLGSQINHQLNHIYFSACIKSCLLGIPYGTILATLMSLCGIAIVVVSLLESTAISDQLLFELLNRKYLWWVTWTSLSSAYKWLEHGRKLLCNFARLIPLFYWSEWSMWGWHKVNANNYTDFGPLRV